MGKSTPQAPTPPDPVATANAQGAINKETAIAQANLNHVNQVTPNGNLTYQQIGSNEDGTPKYQATTSLSPDQQQKLDLTNQAGINTGQIANAQLGRLNTALSTPIDYSHAPALTSSIDPNSPAYQQAETALMSRINPQLDRDQAALDQKLANQGLQPGSEAWAAAQTQQGQNKNDARQQAIMGAYQTALSGAQLGNSARAQDITELASQRNQPLNEISALLSGTQVQPPSFAGTTQTPIQPADFQGAQALQYQGQLANYNSAQQQNNATMGGLFGLGGSILGAGLSPGIGSAGFLLSDRRAKRDIEQVGTFKGYILYSYRYLHDHFTRLGVMAQDVHAVNPAAVAEIDGMLHVNYGAL